MSETNQFSGFEVLLSAIEIEKSGHTFYKAMATKFEQTLAVEIFINLAKDEVEHLQALKDLLSSYQDGSFWEEEEEYLPYLKRFHEEDVFPSPQQVEAALLETDSEQQILDLAIQAERRFSEYFTMAAKHSRTKDGKTVFGWLADEEKRHAELLSERKEKIAVE